MEDAKLMLDAGRAAFRAAKAKDVAALDALNDQLYTSCTSCHQHYRANYGRRPAAPTATEVPAPPALPAPRPPRPSAGGGAGVGCTRRSQQACWIPGVLLFASGVPEISRTSRPAASVIFSFTSPTCFLFSHEMIAAPGGFSPTNVWSPQTS